MTGLAKDAQVDFSAGEVTAVARNLIPGNGLYQAVNGLFDDDGSCYRRGGSQYKSTADFGSSGLRWVWDGTLTGGQRTVFANNADFGVLGADDASVVNLGGAGLAEPVSCVEIAGILFIGGGTLYAGSRKTADYSTGTVALTNGSKVVTGTGTSWSANCDAGMLFHRGSERMYPIASVDSNTQITLRDAYQGVTTASTAYVNRVLGTASTSTYRTASFYAAVAGRLVTLEGNRLYFSNSVLGGGQGPHVFGATDYHELPEGAVGLGVFPVRDTALAFTTQGLWSVSNLVLDLTDDFGNPQQRVERISQDLILWGAAGVATWRGSLVVPAVDGVWLVDGVSQPVRLTNSVTNQVTRYVRANYKAGGGVVHRNHYFLPVYADGSYTVLDLMVCRLDRPTRTPLGDVFPWSHVTGHGGNVIAMAQRAGSNTRQPFLWGASQHTKSRVLDCSGFFEPAAGVKADADGTVFVWDVITRDYATGSLNVNTVRKLRVRYELVDAGTDDPVIAAYVGLGPGEAGGAEWGVSEWGLADWTDSTLGDYAPLDGTAPEDYGRNPWSWRVNKRARYVSYRLRCEDAAQKLVLRSVESFVRAGGRQ